MLNVLKRKNMYIKMSEFTAVFVGEEDISLDIKEEDGSVDIKEECVEEKDPLITTPHIKGNRK